MSSFLELAFVLIIILAAAKLAGLISTRLGQPSVLGELLMGLLLGPSLLDLVHLPMLHNIHLGEVVAEFGELGVLLLMFLAGLELHFHDLVKNTRVSAYAGFLGVLIPVLLGFPIGLLIGLEPTHAFFLGLALGATSVSISAQTLMELKVLRSRVGLGLLGAAVFDDILVILLVSTFLAVESGAGNIQEIVWVFVRMFLFLLLSTGFGLWVLPRLSARIVRLPISQGAVTLALVILLIYGLASEVLGGMAAITGAFLAGLLFARTPEKSQLELGMRALAYGFFVPIFFINIGLQVNLRQLPLNSLWLLFVISFVAVSGKIIGAGLGARLSRYSWLESLQLGIGMISRGEVGLIVASLGLSQGLINQQNFSIIVGMVLISTLVTPPLLRAAFSIPKVHRPDQLVI